MKTDNYQNVELKCAAIPMGKPFTLKIDGHDIKHVRKVLIHTEYDSITIVEIEIIANVNIDIEAETNASRQT